MKLTVQDFIASIENGAIPSNLPVHLQSLWHDGRSDWEKAHSLIDHLEDSVSSHIHAYLHRKEGDLWNADYWYRKAGKQRPNTSIEKEWEDLVQYYL